LAFATCSTRPICAAARTFRTAASTAAPTAREGFLFQPNILIYGQGGAAWTSTNTTVFNLAGTQIGNLSTSSQGWTLGGGGEWMFAPHWSVFAEYNFMGFGGSNIQDIAAGVNYKF
jgi:outer membrane immunogenic protein